MLTRVAVSGLVLTGGDIATAVCAALGAGTLWLQGEVQPGIAVDRAGQLIVLAEGGFGDVGADPASGDHEERDPAECRGHVGRLQL